MDRFVSIDIEATGLNPTQDRIITLALALYDTIPRVGQVIPEDGREFEFDPGIPIPPESTKIHGITDAMVKGNPKFADEAETVSQMIAGRHIIGFNLFGLDLPLLWEEFHRAGTEWDWTQHQLIDVGTLFKIREPRTLEAAVQTYLKRSHEGAHGAWADATATAEVLAAQVAKYTDLQTLSVSGLAQSSRHEPKVDLAGKIVLNAAGDPVFAFGKTKGQRVVDNPGMVQWMLDRDFPTETKLCLKRLMNAASAEAYGSD